MIRRILTNKSNCKYYRISYYFKINLPWNIYSKIHEYNSTCLKWMHRIFFVIIIELLCFLHCTYVQCRKRWLKISTFVLGNSFFWWMASYRKTGRQTDKVSYKSDTHSGRKDFIAVIFLLTHCSVTYRLVGNYYELLRILHCT